MKRSIWIIIVALLLFSIHFSTAQEEFYFYHNDHLGNPVVMTDSNGSVVWEADYEQLDSPFNGIGKDGDLRHRATEKDETGFCLNGLRYYDSEHGRFLQPDRSKFNYNPYVFIEHNPIMNINPRTEPNHPLMQTNYANWMKATNPWWLVGSIYYPENREYDHNQMSFYSTEIIPPLSLVNKNRRIFANGFNQII